MVKTKYTFSALYQDFDIYRIINENSNKSFIEVSWRDVSDGYHAVAIVTDKGVERLHDNGLTVPNRYGPLHVAHDGIGWTPALSLDTNGICLFTNIVTFRSTYNVLIERERKKRQVTVRVY